MLARYQAQPGTEFTSVFEFVSIADCGNQRGRSEWTNAFNFSQNADNVRRG
jgi:hypothetical protein